MASERKKLERPGETLSILGLDSLRLTPLTPPASSEADDDVPLPDLDLLSPQQREQLRAALKSGVPGTFSAQDLEKAARRREETEAYRADPSHFETVFAQPGGLEELVWDLADRADIGGFEMMKAALGDRSSLNVRQRPNGRTALITYLVNLVNAAAGGFAFLTSSTGRQAFWSSFFPYIDRFFIKGGKMVIAIPVGELSEKALDNLRSWTRVYAKAAAGKGGGLRFFFVTEFIGDQSYHIKECCIAAPGGAVAFLVMTANMNARALGLGVLLCEDDDDRRDSPKSAELMRVDIHRLGKDEAAAEELEALAKFWVQAGADNWIILDTPALDDFLAVAGKKSLTSVYNAKRSALLQSIISTVDDPAKRQLEAEKQRAIALAAAPAHASADLSDSGNDSDPPSLTVRTRESRWMRLLTRQHRYLGELQQQHEPEWTEEEQLQIDNMNAQIIEELIEEHPAWEEILNELGQHRRNRRHTKPRPRRHRPPPKASQQSSSNLFGDSSSDDDDDDDEDDDGDSAGGDVAHGGTTSGSQQGAGDGQEVDENTADSSAEEAVETEEEGDYYSMDDLPDPPAPSPPSAKRAPRAAQNAPPAATNARLRRTPSSTPSSQRPANPSRETCNFCLEVPSSNFYKISTFGQHRACRKCWGRIGRMKDVRTFADAQAHCQSTYGARGKYGKKPGK
ncbi:hypothetical protein JCM10213_003937 [Rhodosporidiobolus nylandii]